MLDKTLVPLCPDSAYVLGMHIWCGLCGHRHCQVIVFITVGMSIREWCICCGNKDFLVMFTLYHFYYAITRIGLAVLD